jgi:hypothetical protein
LKYFSKTLFIPVKLSKFSKIFLFLFSMLDEILHFSQNLFIFLDILLIIFNSSVLLSQGIKIKISSHHKDIFDHG